MTEFDTGSGRQAADRGILRQGLALSVACGSVLLLVGCAAQQPVRTASGGRVWDPKLGVWSSPRLVADGDSVPRGGGSYLTGRPYRIAGRTYVPRQDANGYSVVGTASWYGDAFHGRRTANGEIFDKGSISAAHPTLPLPSYVRVTNMKNGRSLIVRVNDRGPYHGGRVMDVSQRVAEALAFKGEGTAHIRVDYVGRAGLQGSDDQKLIATLRTDGTPAQLDGMPSAPPTMVASAEPDEPKPAAPAQPESATAPEPVRRAEDETSAPPTSRLAVVPLPPSRPFTLEGDGGVATPTRRRLGVRDRVAASEATGTWPAPTRANAVHSVDDVLRRSGRTRAALNNTAD